MSRLMQKFEAERQERATWPDWAKKAYDICGRPDCGLPRLSSVHEIPERDINYPDQHYFVETHMTVKQVNTDE